MSYLSIPDQEFIERQNKTKAAAKAAGYDALLIWSRGGNTVEAYGDVYYLSNFHSTFPMVSDTPYWTNKGHAAIVLPVDGDPILITDYVDDPEDRIKVRDVRIDLDVAKGAIRALRSSGLLDKRIGLVGRSTLLHSAMEFMRDEAGTRLENLEPADHILEAERAIKSPAELAMLRHSASVGTKWMNATLGAIAEGRTEADAVGEGLRVLAANGGVQQDVAISSGPNAGNYFGSTGVPHWNWRRKMQNGDLVHLDQWGPVDGYYTDFARSTVVGGKASNGQKEVLEASIALIDTIIAAVKPGQTFGDLFEAGQTWLDDNGFGRLVSACSANGPATPFPCFGHMVGLGLDGPYIVENDPTVLQPNMVLAVETLLFKDGIGCANFEQNLIVQEDGVEIMTDSCERRFWS